MNPDARRIRFNGEEQGPFPVGKLYRMALRGDFDHAAEFFCRKSNQWLPIAGIIRDLETTVTTEQRTKQLKAAAVKKVEFLAGDANTDCPSCRAIARKIHSIDNVPRIPPADCHCIPWCRLIVVACL